jgi:hypothetical protein
VIPTGRIGLVIRSGVGLAAFGGADAWWGAKETTFAAGEICPCALTVGKLTVVIRGESALCVAVVEDLPADASLLLARSLQPIRQTTPRSKPAREKKLAKHISCQLGA